MGKDFNETLEEWIDNIDERKQNPDSNTEKIENRNYAHLVEKAQKNTETPPLEFRSDFKESDNIVDAVHSIHTFGDYNVKSINSNSSVQELGRFVPSINPFLRRLSNTEFDFLNSYRNWAPLTEAREPICTRGCQEVIGASVLHSYDVPWVLKSILQIIDNEQFRGQHPQGAPVLFVGIPEGKFDDYTNGLRNAGQKNVNSVKSYFSRKGYEFIPVAGYTATFEQPGTLHSGSMKVDGSKSQILGYEDVFEFGSKWDY